MNYQHTQKLLELAEQMADYLCDVEREDYFKWCGEEHPDSDPYEINIHNLQHIFETRMYFMHLLGTTQIDERWKFISSRKIEELKISSTERGTYGTVYKFACAGAKYRVVENLLVFTLEYVPAGDHRRYKYIRNFDVLEDAKNYIFTSECP